MRLNGVRGPQAQGLANLEEERTKTLARNWTVSSCYHFSLLAVKKPWGNGWDQQAYKHILLSLSMSLYRPERMTLDCISRKLQLTRK